MLRSLSGAEAALVVNNCAAATTLMLAALAAGRGVVISRGQLIEIGGGFRVPDVLRQSGAKLVEVGTTNKVRAADYAAAAVDRLVHHSVLVELNIPSYRAEAAKRSKQAEATGAQV